MRSLKMILLGVLLIVSSVSIANATTFTFSTSSLNTMSHPWYTTWGINLAVPEGETIVGATLELSNIYNWNNQVNDLYVHLLDSATSGVSHFWEGRDLNSYNNAFEGKGLALGHYKNLGQSPINIIYNFEDTDLTTLMVYVADGNFGFGFDPDCYYINSGVTFSIETAATPIPAPILLLGTGLIGMAGFRRKFKRD